MPPLTGLPARAVVVGRAFKFGSSPGSEALITFIATTAVIIIGLVTYHVYRFIQRCYNRARVSDIEMAPGGEAIELQDLQRVNNTRNAAAPGTVNESGNRLAVAQNALLPRSNAPPRRHQRVPRSAGRPPTIRNQSSVYSNGLHFGTLHESPYETVEEASSSSAVPPKVETESDAQNQEGMMPNSELLQPGTAKEETVRPEGIRASVAQLARNNSDSSLNTFGVSSSADETHKPTNQVVPSHENSQDGDNQGAVQVDETKDADNENHESNNETAGSGVTVAAQQQPTPRRRRYSIMPAYNPEDSRFDIFGALKRSSRRNTVIGGSSSAQETQQSSSENAPASPQSPSGPASPYSGLEREFTHASLVPEPLAIPVRRSHSVQEPSSRAADEATGAAADEATGAAADEATGAAADEATGAAADEATDAIPSRPKHRPLSEFMRRDSPVDPDLILTPRPNSFLIQGWPNVSEGPEEGTAAAIRNGRWSMAPPDEIIEQSRRIREIQEWKEEAANVVFDKAAAAGVMLEPHQVTERVDAVFQRSSWCKPAASSPQAGESSASGAAAPRPTPEQISPGDSKSYFID